MSIPSDKFNNILHPKNLVVLIAQIGVGVGLTRATIDAVASKLMAQRSPVFERYTPGAHDVVVATYAKSGTNWALQICVQIAHRGAAEFNHIHDLVPWPEALYPEVVSLDDPAPRLAAPTGMRVIKTHLPAPGVPYQPAAKFVTVIRDPKEVLVSAYYFLLGMLGLTDKITPQQWLDLSLESELFLRRWAEHTAGYWAWRARPNVFVRTFNELRADLPGAVDAIAALMGVELEAKERELVIERSSFPYMKAHDACFRPPRSIFVAPDKHPNMIRAGKVGESGAMIDAERGARIDALCREHLRRAGSDFPYDEAFAVEPRAT